MTFDYEKEKKFEEQTNHLHYEHLMSYFSDKSYNIAIKNVDDVDIQRKGIDLIIELDDNEKINVELKTDKHTSSPNLFLEDVSNFEGKSVGWTVKCEADILSYAFYDLNNKRLDRIYFYDMPKLKKWFIDNYKCYPPKWIQNKGYRSRGRAIPIVDTSNFLLWKWNFVSKIERYKLRDFF